MRLRHPSTEDQRTLRGAATEQPTGLTRVRLIRPHAWAGRLVMGLLATAAASAVLGSGCSTVEPGEDFQIADVVFDEDFYYCEVEPVLFQNSCGPGSGSDAAGGCHFNVTSFRLADYTPRLGDSCQNGSPTISPPEAARGNYQSAQSMMRRDPELAPLFNRPTGTTAHPRRIFEPTSPDALVIREWAERFSSQ